VKSVNVEVVTLPFDASPPRGLRYPGMNTSDLITIDPDILGGTPVFKGTRVPVKTLFEYLEDNYSLDEFLECFPTVTREMARKILERSESALLSPAAA
jgi:uncharacterized protein (DUF433 family)